MDFKLLRHFTVISELKNLSRAARELHVAQPSLSVEVKKIENELGAKLLERSKQGVKLTSAGLHFVEYCEKTLQSWGHICNEIANITSEVKGTIKLGVHPSVAIYTLPLFMSKILNDFPALRFELHHDLSRRVLEDVANQKIDLGLVINPDPRPQLVIRYLWDDYVTVYHHKKIKNDSILIYDPNLSQVQAVIRQLATQNIQFSRTLESGNLEVISQLIQSGVGHGILPQRVLPNEGSGFLPSFASQIQPVKDRLAYVCRPDFVKTTKGKAMIEALRQIKDKSV